MVGSDGEARVSGFSRVFFVVEAKMVGRVQIQIILYLLKLSLPGPAPPPPAPLESPKKRKRSVRPQPAVPVLTLEDHLEVFMDKLSMWQLVATLDLSGKLRDTKDERDWMQIFCEDIIEPQYVSCPLCKSYQIDSGASNQVHGGTARPMCHPPIQSLPAALIRPRFFPRH